MKNKFTIFLCLGMLSLTIYYFALFVIEPMGKMSLWNIGWGLASSIGFCMYYYSWKIGYNYLKDEPLITNGMEKLE